MDPKALPELRAVFFDLDGTLLQVEMGEFIPAYIDGLSGWFSDLSGRELFSRTVLAATRALLVADDPRTTNQELFHAALHNRLGIDGELFGERLGRFCADGLSRLAPLVRPLPLARTILRRCFERGLTVVIATNPVFPRAIVDARLDWGGLGDFPFHLVTSFENSRYCKPHQGYFEDLLGHFGLAPRECLMVGNDTEHDLAASQLGIPTFLVDTWMVDRLGGAWQADFVGGHGDLDRLLGGSGARLPLRPGPGRGAKGRNN